MYFVFPMFDTVFYIKYIFFKQLFLVVMHSGFLMYFFFQQCNLLWILYLGEI